MSGKIREALEKFSAVDLSKLKFPLDGDSSAIYNSDKKEITIPYWMVAELLNEVKAAQDIAKSALAEPLRNCDVGTAAEQNLRHGEWCRKHGIDGDWDVNCASPDMGCHLCFARWAQMPYEEVK
jgi:hypothetical protein